MGMYNSLLVTWCVLLGSGNSQLQNGTFPDGFLWAASTSAYQVEGAWNVSGKGEHIWDTFCHEGRCSGESGDVACDSYNLYNRDIEILQEVGVQVYRFSISWSRILPTGTLAGGVNQAGIDYYNNLIDAVIGAGLTPMVILYNWDLPQPLQDIGGWEVIEIVTHFKDYSRIAFDNFGDRVQWWITINEPFVVAWLGYGNGIFAPGSWDPGQGGYKAGHNLLIAHAEVWHIYNDTYRATQGGKLSITLDADWNEPQNTSNQEDIDAAERAMQFKLGWFGNPIFGSGDYPSIMREMITNKSNAQGIPSPRIPGFTTLQINRIRGTFDFMSLNHFTTYLVYYHNHGYDCINYDCDSDFSVSRDPSWPTSGSDWLRVVPWGMRKLLNWVKNEYGDIPIFITENGISDRNTTLDDPHRTDFFTAYINEALKANVLDNVNVIGYGYNAIMDSLRWNMGYVEKFGLYHVDFEDPARPRTARTSAASYAQIIANNGFP